MAARSLRIVALVVFAASLLLAPTFIPGSAWTSAAAQTIGDYDEDGVPDDIDNCPVTQNPDQADFDENFHGDVCDLSATPWDLDGDFFGNDWDNCPTVSNPDQFDDDQDRIGDPCDVWPQLFGPNDLDWDYFKNDVDNCPRLNNSNQEDTDGDGIGDACEAPWWWDDQDNDGVTDDLDNCILGSNPSQTNSDGDLFGDVCDRVPDNADGDFDFILNGVDNCPSYPNRDQADPDGDGLGWGCDTLQPQGDADNDGTVVGSDNCPAEPNPDQANADGDALGDACDLPMVLEDADGDGVEDELDNCGLVPNPDQANTDVDEFAVFGDACDGPSINIGDVDGDGVENGTFGWSLDNCPIVPNPNQANIDVDYGFWDFHGDACDSPFVPPDGYNAPPILDWFGTVEAVEGETSTIVDASRSRDPEGHELSFSWDFEDDGSIDASGPTLEFSAVGYDGPRRVVVGLDVCDPEGACSVAAFGVLVRNAAPKLSDIAVLEAPKEGQTATVTVDAADPAGDLDTLAYEVDCDGDGTYEIGPQAGNSANCAFADDGTYIANVRVSDEDGGVTTESIEILVENEKPTATLVVSNTSAAVGEIYVLSTSDVSDPSSVDAAAGFTYAFDCGDGVYSAFGTSTSVTCTATGPGKLKVHVLVRDKDGGVRTLSDKVDIT